MGSKGRDSGCAAVVEQLLPIGKLYNTRYAVSMTATSETARISTKFTVARLLFSAAGVMVESKR
jgi:uncharacterized protein YceK